MSCIELKLKLLDSEIEKKTDELNNLCEQYNTLLGQLNKKSPSSQEVEDPLNQSDYDFIRERMRQARDNMEITKEKTIEN